jgi:hypothetical protein
METQVNVSGSWNMDLSGSPSGFPGGYRKGESKARMGTSGWRKTVLAVG